MGCDFPLEDELKLRQCVRRLKKKMPEALKAKSAVQSIGALIANTTGSGTDGKWTLHDCSSVLQRIAATIATALACLALCAVAGCAGFRVPVSSLQATGPGGYTKFEDMDPEAEVLSADELARDYVPRSEFATTAVSTFTNDVGYVTNAEETDPNVSAWAKASTKPTYAYSEITGTPTNVSTFVNDANYITTAEETDPNVSAWAKASTKPTYAYSEITGTPTNVSAFINDAQYSTVPYVDEISETKQDRWSFDRYTVTPTVNPNNNSTVQAPICFNTTGLLGTSESAKLKSFTVMTRQYHSPTTLPGTCIAKIVDTADSSTVLGISDEVDVNAWTNNFTFTFSDDVVLKANHTYLFGVCPASNPGILATFPYRVDNHNQSPNLYIQGHTDWRPVVSASVYYPIDTDLNLQRQDLTAMKAILSSIESNINFGSETNLNQVISVLLDIKTTLSPLVSR